MARHDSQPSNEPTTDGTSHLVSQPRHIGRGAQSRPANRFERVHFDSTELVDEAASSASSGKLATQYMPDHSQSIVSENQSPDISFRYSVNPYRGCAHGCSYCYARPTHEYLGFDAGLDFETKILVKHDAPQLFRKWLTRPAWHCEPVMFSGVTDCYQPAEEEFRLTRACLEVALEAHQPISIVTKNARVMRDLDLLSAMAARRLVHVAISVTSLDQSLTRVMEPRTSSPRARLEAMAALAKAGIPTQVMVAPIIPGLNDHEVPAILKEAAEHGAAYASFVVLRLPQTVQPVFVDWLQTFFPDRVSRVLGRQASVRDGKLNDSTFGQRMRGTGAIAEQIGLTFRVFAERYDLRRKPQPLDCDQFHPPRLPGGQMRLF